ncbi:META domain-containing protein [Nakamurella flavida]|uniref:META domain-containing protein n=1 Tax=Nakamurella flavida TaxID=363630 RepID=A0A938YS67_9ACTN|nr:META domain-containing protein [Nakamurella flavida]MBM9478452.1 META domain-containing protein [Nakamurella flavida]MDP9777724.1 heat shock protein HslJ [Nakamurella flavida]
MTDHHGVRWTGLAGIGLAGALLLSGCARTSVAEPGAAATSAPVSSAPATSAPASSASVTPSAESGSVDPGAIMLPSGEVPPADPTGTPAVEGVGWRLSGLLVGGDAVGAVPDGTDAWMVLQDGRLLLRTGCNSGGAAYTVDGTALTVEPIATTKMACTDDAIAEVERSMLGVLQGGAVMVRDGDELLLTAVAEQGGLAFTVDPAVLQAVSSGASSASPTTS